MKKIITIFILPHEIDLYRDLMERISNDLVKYDLTEFWVDSTLCVNEEMVNWEKSQVSKQQVIDWFNEVNIDLPGDFTIDFDGDVMGCVDKRRESTPTKYPEAVSFTWLDADILFPEGSLYIINEAVSNLGGDGFILTPQYPKMWDESWDILVHPNYKNTPYNYMEFESYNPELYYGIFGEVSLIPLPSKLFKFGGGHLTTISSKILDLIPIPKSFGSYGEEDTFIMQMCSLFTQKYNFTQYIINNLVYSQKNRDHLDRRKDIDLKDRRKEFRQIALNNFPNEVSLLYNKIFKNIS
jgi:hypothetical protein